MISQNSSINISVYKKILFSYIIIIVITVSTICTVLFLLFSNSATKEISKSSQAMLTQTGYVSNFLYEQVSSVANMLSNDSTIMKVLYTEKKDPLDEYQAVSRLRQISTVYRFIKYMGIYNEHTKRYVTDLGVPVFPDQDSDIISLLGSAPQNEFLRFIPRKSTFPVGLNSAQASVNVLTFIIYPNYLFSVPIKGAIIVNIDEAYVRKTIQSMRSNHQDNIFIMDLNGKILSHTNPDLFLNDYSKMQYVQKILKYPGLQGYFVTTVDDQKELVTFIKSPALNWYFVDARPYNYLLSNIHTLRNITLLVAFLIMLISTVLSLKFVQVFYNPLKALVEKVNAIFDKFQFQTRKYNEFDLLSEAFSTTIERANSLESSLKTAYPMFKETYFRSILMGDFENHNDISMLQNMNMEWIGPYFCVIVIKVDGYKHSKKEICKSGQTLLRNIIGSITQELIRQEYQCEPVGIEEDEFAVLMQLQENIMPDSLHPLLEYVQSTVTERYGLSTSFFIGDIVSNRDDIHISYESALEYGNYRLFLDYGCVIDYNKIKFQLDNYGEYPYSIENKLLKALESTNKDNVEVELRLFIDALRTLNYQHALIYCDQVVISIVKHFATMIDIKFKGCKNYFEALKELQSLDTLDNIHDRLKKFCFEICSIVDETKNKSNSQKIYQAQEYLERHYADPNVSLELVSEYVGLSAGYFGKLFRSITNANFTDYLNNIRLEKSKELLTSTDYPIAVICQKVGIYNSTYYFTLFKKAFGITPALYRKQSGKVAANNT